MTVGAHFMASCRIIPQRAAKSFTMLWKRVKLLLNNPRSVHLSCRSDCHGLNCVSPNPYLRLNWYQYLRVELIWRQGFKEVIQLKG